MRTSKPYQLTADEAEAVLREIVEWMCWNSLMPSKAYPHAHRWASHVLPPDVVKAKKAEPLSFQDQIRMCAKGKKP